MRGRPTTHSFVDRREKRQLLLPTTREGKRKFLSWFSPLSLLMCVCLCLPCKATGGEEKEGGGLVGLVFLRWMEKEEEKEAWTAGGPEERKGT